MTITIGKADHEAAGWRGLIIDRNGNVLTRTLNLYPDADKAIAAALRLHEHQQRRAAVQDGAA